MLGTSTPTTIVEKVNFHRSSIETMADSVRNLMDHDDFKQGDSDDKRDIGEMKANIMLAFRHLEDARMRLGKVLQAHDGGKSVYDKKQ